MMCNGSAARVLVISTREAYSVGTMLSGPRMQSSRAWASSVLVQRQLDRSFSFRAKTLRYGCDGRVFVVGTTSYICTSSGSQTCGRLLKLSMGNAPERLFSSSSMLPSTSDGSMRTNSSGVKRRSWKARRAMTSSSFVLSGRLCSLRNISACASRPISQVEMKGIVTSFSATAKVRRSSISASRSSSTMEVRRFPFRGAFGLSGLAPSRRDRLLSPMVDAEEYRHARHSHTTTLTCSSANLRKLVRLDLARRMGRQSPRPASAAISGRIFSRRGRWGMTGNSSLKGR
mmetsp:Transcript_11462/g.42777  ORF Transcript_11462/g.42777 Transcript_11462/m.42777 type:complete len:287 (+) Transcript_11462:369-1229(+)